jgi:hypothetical protein
MHNISNFNKIMNSQKAILHKIKNNNHYKIPTDENNLYHKYQNNINKNKYHKINLINNIKLNPIKPINIIKPIPKYIDREEYFQQIPEIYNIDEFKNKLIYLKKILLTKNIFLIKTGWDTVWDNETYSLDRADEIICKRYGYIIKKKYNLYDNKYNLSKYNYPEKIMNLLYTKEIVSFVVISDYSIYSGKKSGIIKINVNFIDDKEKNIIFSCIRETFLDRYKYDETTKTFSIQLKRK